MFQHQYTRLRRKDILQIESSFLQMTNLTKSLTKRLSKVSTQYQFPTTWQWTSSKRKDMPKSSKKSILNCLLNNPRSSIKWRPRLTFLQMSWNNLTKTNLTKFMSWWEESKTFTKTENTTTFTVRMKPQENSSFIIWNILRTKIQQKM